MVIIYNRIYFQHAFIKIKYEIVHESQSIIDKLVTCDILERSLTFNESNDSLGLSDTWRSTEGDERFNHLSFGFEFQLINHPIIKICIFSLTCSGCVLEK